MIQALGFTASIVLSDGLFGAEFKELSILSSPDLYALVLESHLEVFADSVPAREAILLWRSSSLEHLKTTAVIH